MISLAPGMAVTPSADSLSLMIPALGLLVLVLVVARMRPRLAVAVWFAVLCLVPVWVEVSVKYAFPAAVVVTMILVAALFPTVPHEFGISDWLVVGLFAAAIAAYFAGVGDKSATMVLVTYWGAAYLLGRTIILHTGLHWIYRCAAVAFTVVAVGALIEFAFSWNPFVLIHAGNSLYSTWAPIQMRGGMLRAEGAFGHSIALGASVALAIPMAIASRFSLRTRALMLLAMLACEVVTFSRAGMVCAGLAVALMAVFGREGLSARLRSAVVTALIAVAVAATPIVTDTYEQAGAEASRSADYRWALTSLIPHISLFGRSPDMYVTASGNHYVGDFRSIDSALILLGLTYGLVPLILAVGLLLGGIYLVACRSATAPTIAVVAQLPAFLSVALITQYQVLVWFMVGLAVCTQVMERPDTARRRMRSKPTARASAHPVATLNVIGDRPVVAGGKD